MEALAEVRRCEQCRSPLPASATGAALLLDTVPPPA